MPPFLPRFRYWRIIAKESAMHGADNSLAPLQHSLQKWSWWVMVYSKRRWASADHKWWPDCGWKASWGGHTFRHDQRYSHGFCSCPCRCLIWAGSPDQPQATEKNSVQSTTRPISENKFCLKHRKWKIFFSKNCDVTFDLHFIYRIDKSSLDIRRLDRKIFLQPASKFYAVVIKDKLKLSRQLSESLSNKNPNRAGLN